MMPNVHPRGSKNIKVEQRLMYSGDAGQCGTWGLLSGSDSVTMRAYRGGREAGVLQHG